MGTYNNFDYTMAGKVQRPWAYEVLAALVYNPTGETRTITMTFDHVPTNEEIATEGERHMDKIQYHIDNPPDLAAEWYRIETTA